MKNIYRRMYSYKNDQKLYLSPRINILLQILNKLNMRNKNILDTGCYDGTLLSSIRNRNNLYGIDASDHAVKESRKKGLIVKKFFFNDISQIPFNKNFFDLIVSCEFIEHLYDVDFYLTEINRLLKNSGLLLISTPNIASFSRRLLLLFGKNPYVEISPNEYDSVGHIRYFTFESLKKILKKHRFEIIKRVGDVVNFAPSGQIRSRLLAQIFPSIGQSVIYLAKKTK